MIFVESRAFSLQRAIHMDDIAFRELQRTLLASPNSGSLIVGTGGLRKLRWGAGERGKRGGVRVIYFPLPRRSVILLLLLYPKNEQEDLTAAQRRVLRAVVAAEIRAHMEER